MNKLKVLEESIAKFEENLNYVFSEKKNILLALTHSSYANERKNEFITSNERLEFLGDAVLNIIISEKIFKKHTKLKEGDMTKARANIVCETSLIECAKKIEIGKYILLGKGEENTGGRTRVSILSDAFEAVIGAIYIDGGFNKVKRFILKQMEQLIEDAVSGVVFMDHKTLLQEVVQKKGENKVVYEIIEEKGPDHNKVFVSQVKISENIMGIGEGNSKKEAEQSAAKVALIKYGEGNE
jgi:ribonuclease III